MARSQLDIILKLTDKASPGLKKFQAGLGAVAAAATAAKVAGELWQAGMEGANLNRAQRAFSSMARSVGQDAGQMAKAMQDATGGAVDFQTSMGNVSRAIKLGVADTPEEIEALTRAAANLGAAMGRTADEALNDIITGIGRMSPLILDNIGIMTNGGQVFEDYAKQIGKTAKELTDAEKKQALFNSAVESGNVLINAQATEYEKVQTAIKDLADAMKQDLAVAIGDSFGGIAEELFFLLEFRRAVDDLGWSSERTANFIWNYAGSSRDAKQAILELAAEQERMIQSAGRADDLFANYATGLRDIGSAAGEAAVQQHGLVTSFSDLTSAQVAAEGLDALNTSLEEGKISPEQYEGAFRLFADELDISPEQQALHLELAEIDADMKNGISTTNQWIARLLILTARLADMEAAAAAGGAGGAGGVQQQHGGSFTVPPGFPNDSFPARFSSGETVSVSNDSRSFFSGSNVNINNGTQLEAFEEILKQIQ